MSDMLLDLVFSDSALWEKAILDGDAKKIRGNVLENFSDPEYREKIKAKIAAREYHIRPPHEAQVPKDDGTMRTVYANEAADRVLLAVVNNIFFKHCPGMIHPKCVSYQATIGCGKIDRRVSKDIQALDIVPGSRFGYKIDLSKYFDSVPLEYIDAAFDEIEKRLGKSSVMDMVREYYHDDTLVALDGSKIHKYTSLRQGCAIAAFLADAVLYDIDEAVSSMDVIYYRYSDDILILGPEADAAFGKLSAMLDAKSLTLNPKKVEALDSRHWFTFLGFSLRGRQITLSKKRVKNLQKEIEKRTIKCRGLKPETALRKVYMYLYDSSLTKYGYADGILPVITSEHDMREIDRFILDCVRACATGRKRIGGLGYDKLGTDGVITRGKGRNVRANMAKLPRVEGYVPISYMRELYLSSREVYGAYVKEMMLA